MEDRPTNVGSSFISPTGAARLLNVSEQTVRQMGRRGELKRVELENGRAVYERHSVEAAVLRRGTTA